METVIQQLHASALFEGISDVDLERFVTCLSPRTISISRGGYVFRADDPVEAVYILLRGCVQIVDVDFWGNQSIIETMNPNDFFGEAYVLSGAKQHIVNVIASEDTTVLLLSPERLFKTCAKACDCHVRLQQNVMCILARKIVLLTEKMNHMTKRTTREKLSSYFSTCADRACSPRFSIPYSRQGLADFLSVERTALSHELARMRDEGLLLFTKNCFELLKP